MIRSVENWRNHTSHVGWIGIMIFTVRKSVSSDSDVFKLRNLMARDDFKNLGFSEEPPSGQIGSNVAARVDK